MPYSVGDQEAPRVDLPRCRQLITLGKKNKKNQKSKTINKKYQKLIKKLIKKSKINKKSKMHQKRNWAPYHFLGTISNWFQNDANRNSVFYHLVVERAPETQYWVPRRRKKIMVFWPPGTQYWVWGSRFIRRWWRTLLRFASFWNELEIVPKKWYGVQFRFGTFSIFC